MPLSLVDLEIDHILPLSTPPDRLVVIQPSLGLGDNFTLDCCENLVPTHRNCNLQKSALEFADANLRYYLELWRAKQERINVELRKIEKQRKSDGLLAQLGLAIQNNWIGRADVNGFLESLPQQAWVVAFGVYLPDLPEPELASSNPIDLVGWYDSLESELSTTIRTSVTAETACVESERNGESHGVRYIFWEDDLPKLRPLDIEPWKILEVETLERIYGTDELIRFGLGR